MRRQFKWELGRGKTNGGSRRCPCKMRNVFSSSKGCYTGCVPTCIFVPVFEGMEHSRGRNGFLSFLGGGRGGGSDRFDKNPEHSSDIGGAKNRLNGAYGHLMGS